MLKLVLASLAVAILTSGAEAQNTTPGAVPPAAARDADPALWVVKDDDTTIYLFGTVHVLKPGLSWFDEAVRQAFDKSDTVVLEMIEPQPAEVGGLVKRFARNEGGPSLTTLLPPGKRAAYAAAMREAGMPATAFDEFDPWFPAVYLSVATLPKYGYDPKEGPDKIIARAAEAAGKRVVGLETPEQQFAVFDGLPQPVQLSYLVTALDMLDETGPTLDRMVDRWAAGDPEGLSAIMNEGMRDLPEVAKALLADRNARWAEWIKARLDTPGTVFVAVGGGHLASADSVQANLRKRKLTVTRIDY